MTGAVELGSFESQMIQKLTIIVHPFIISEYPEAIFEVVDLKQTETVQDYYEKLEGFCNLLQLTEEDALQIFINNLNPNISKFVRFFCPNSLTHALKLAKQLEFLYEQPNEHSSPDSNTTPAVKQQTVMSTPPKQSSSPTILTKPTNETTDNPFFPLNPLQKNDLNLILEEIDTVTNEAGAITQAPIDRKTSWSNQETETKAAAMKDQIQVKETTKFGDGKLQTKVGGDHSDQVEQHSVTDQNHRLKDVKWSPNVVEMRLKFGNNEYSDSYEFRLLLMENNIGVVGLRNLDQSLNEHEFIISYDTEVHTGFVDDSYARSDVMGACDLVLIIGELIVLNVISGVNSEKLSLIYIVGGPNSNDYGINKILHHTIEWLDFSQELRHVQTVNCCYHAAVLGLGVVISLEKKNQSFLTPSSTPKLKETKGGMMIDEHIMRFSISAACLGLLDTGFISYGELVDQGRQITQAVAIPVIGDGDNGYGNALNVKRTVKGYIRAGFAGIILEDQVSPKACGHIQDKKVVFREEAVRRIKATVDARKESGSDIVIVARTNSRQALSLEESLWRSRTFANAGADIIFIDALASKEEMKFPSTEGDESQKNIYDGCNDEVMRWIAFVKSSLKDSKAYYDGLNELKADLTPTSILLGIRFTLLETGVIFFMQNREDHGSVSKNMLMEKPKLAPQIWLQKAQATVKPEQVYQQKLIENLFLDYEERPFRIMVFGGSPKSSRKFLCFVDEMRQEQASIFDNDIKQTQYRCIPKGEKRILDTSGLRNDYYVNIMSWGTNNILAVALGLEVYLLNSEDHSVHKLLQICGGNDFFMSVTWSMDARTLAVGYMCSKLQLWDVESSKLIRNLQGHSGRIAPTAWNGHILTLGSCNKSIISHDVKARNDLASYLKKHAGEVCGLKWSNEGNRLASGGNKNLLYIWEASKMSSSKFLHRLSDHCAPVKALAWCPYQQNVLVFGGDLNDRCIKIWNTQKGICINSIETKAQICGLMKWTARFVMDSANIMTTWIEAVASDCSYVKGWSYYRKREVSTSILVFILEDKDVLKEGVLLHAQNAEFH